MKDNWYIVLGLEYDPAVNDENIISKKIEEKLKFWASHISDFRMGGSYKLWLESASQIRKDMLGSDNIRAQLAKEARDTKYGQIDGLLRVIGEEGSVTNEELEKLSKKLGESTARIAKRAKALGIRIEEEKAVQDPYKVFKECMPEGLLVYQTMQKLLDAVVLKDLYEFLGVKNGGTSVKAAALLGKAEERKKDFRKNSQEDSIGLKLCGYCEKIFADEKSREDYDNYIIYSEVTVVFDEIVSVSEIKGRLSDSQSAHYIDKLSGALKQGRESARGIFMGFCAEKNINAMIGSLSAPKKMALPKNEPRKFDFSGSAPKTPAQKNTAPKKQEQPRRNTEKKKPEQNIPDGMKFWRGEQIPPKTKEPERPKAQPKGIRRTNGCVFRLKDFAEGGAFDVMYGRYSADGAHEPWTEARLGVMFYFYLGKITSLERAPSDAYLQRMIKDALPEGLRSEERLCIVLPDWVGAQTETALRQHMVNNGVNVITSVRESEAVAGGYLYRLMTSDPGCLSYGAHSVIVVSYDITETSVSLYTCSKNGAMYDIKRLSSERYESADFMEALVAAELIRTFRANTGKDVQDLPYRKYRQHAADILEQLNTRGMAEVTLRRMLHSTTARIAREQLTALGSSDCLHAMLMEASKYPSDLSFSQLQERDYAVIGGMLRRASEKAGSKPYDVCVCVHKGAQNSVTRILEDPGVRSARNVNVVRSSDELLSYAADHAALLESGILAVFS